MTLDTIQDFFEDYKQLLKEGKFKFVFDLRNVDFIDSSGLGIIIMGISRVVQKNTKLKIVLSPDNDTLQQTFQIANISMGVEYYNDVDSAVASF